mmetsp:Transcript_60768/g.130565  ORF Transcript_60768/g.130565 Transcript_60768/m.130565 type:complete len:282 (+) Transcript_60768:79-924(+)
MQSADWRDFCEHEQRGLEWSRVSEQVPDDLAENAGREVNPFSSRTPAYFARGLAHRLWNDSFMTRLLVAPRTECPLRSPRHHAKMLASRRRQLEKLPALAVVPEPAATAWSAESPLGSSSAGGCRTRPHLVSFKVPSTPPSLMDGHSGSCDSSVRYTPPKSARVRTLAPLEPKTPFPRAGASADMPATGPPAMEMPGAGPLEMEALKAIAAEQKRLEAQRQVAVAEKRRLAEMKRVEATAQLHSEARRLGLPGGSSPAATKRTLTRLPPTSSARLGTLIEF